MSMEFVVNWSRSLYLEKIFKYLLHHLCHMMKTAAYCGAGIVSSYSFFHLTESEPRLSSCVVYLLNFNLKSIKLIHGLKLFRKWLRIRRGNRDNRAKSYTAGLDFFVSVPL
jgi:hypothetical protein